METFAIRTIRKGKVKIKGSYFAVNEQHLKYDGRLDGLRFAFGIYEGQPDFVNLWGTERAFHSEESGVDWPGPACVDGSFPWEWWDKVRGS